MNRLPLVFADEHDPRAKRLDFVPIVDVHGVGGAKFDPVLQHGQENTREIDGVVQTAVVSSLELQAEMLQHILHSRAPFQHILRQVDPLEEFGQVNEEAEVGGQFGVIDAAGAVQEQSNVKTSAKKM